MFLNSEICPVILSVDDDEDAQVLLQRAFHKKQIKASLRQVGSGHNLVHYLAGEREYADRAAYPLPTVILLDLKMPGFSGFDVLEFLGKRRELRPCPILVFSSSSHTVDVERAYALGCHSYLVKPTDFHQLSELMVSIEKEFCSPADAAGGSSMFATKVIPNKAKVGAAAEHKSAVPPVQKGAGDLYKHLVEHIKDYAIFMLDTEGRVISWNEGARRINGYDTAEILGKHISYFYTPQDIENDKAEFELKTAQEMGRYEEEGWRVRKDGSRFWANIVISPIRDSSGRLTGFAKVTRDLTQRKLQEENMQKLLESEERFRLLVDQVRDYAIFILDAKGNIASWNQGARRIKGYTADEIIGRHFSVFYTPEEIVSDKPGVEIATAIRDGRVEEEGWRVRKDGSRFWASVVITALWDKRGNLSGFAKVTRDLTARKREEDALREKTRELEVFAHTLSHDLRAPLRSISSFAEILRSESKDLSESEKESYLSKIVRSAQSMNTLITDILQLSELSLLAIPENVFTLDSILTESLDLLEGEIRSTNAQIDIQGPLGEVIGNRTLLVQVFTNLLANSMKFAVEGSRPRIEVFAGKTNGTREIHVKDAGVGIPADFQESIFNVFERGSADSTVTGTGVGLAIVKKAVERMGGTVTVHSKEGKGSDFVIRLLHPMNQPAPERTDLIAGNS